MLNQFTDMLWLAGLGFVGARLTEHDGMVCISGQNGMADVDFSGELVIATIETDEIYHSWEIFPGDFEESVQKICELLFRAR
jgi:hypothetical protein